ncbi:MAG: hypothetical protein JO062_08070 [Bryobacterales bacterium]|nr:hypothetical protein [Bryobacterales bacterium]
MRRTAILLAIPPCGMLAVLIWQVILGRPWGHNPMSNASVIGWTIFLWLVYLRLMTVRIVTDVRNSQLRVAMRGLWRAQHVPLSDISSVEIASFHAVRDYGGYGIRTIRGGKAYIGSGNRGVRVRLRQGSILVIGSQRPQELAAALSK